MGSKKLFVDEGARLSTVNRDVAVRQGEEFWTIDQLNNANDQYDTAQTEPEPAKESNLPSYDDCLQEENREHNELNEETETQNDDGVENEETNDAGNSFTYKDIRKGYCIKFNQKIQNRRCVSFMLIWGNTLRYNFFNAKKNNSITK